jgi:hypothetical protein
MRAIRSFVKRWRLGVSLPLKQNAATALGFY